MAEDKVYSVDKATVQMIEKSRRDGVLTIFDRAEDMKPCPIGSVGSCCKHCSMGPCRVNLSKKDEEAGRTKTGLCGATASTIAARNFIRMIAAGSASHSDHSRDVVEVFISAAKGEIPGYQIADENKLIAMAMDYGVETEGKEIKEIAIALGEKCQLEFGKQTGQLIGLNKAPEKRKEIWRKEGVWPRGIDREVVEIMHRTHIGVDQDFRSLIQQGTRSALADGWCGSMISTDLQDIMFGTPTPVYSEINLGVLRKDMVNVIVNGHEPLLSEMLVVASQDPEMTAYAKTKGAEGVNLTGMCCTGNEILLRHGIPLAGNFLQQELSIITGAVEAMVVDVQCIMQSLQDVSLCYHTKLITTSPKGNIPGATKMYFNEHDALNSAKQIIRVAIDNFQNRKSEVMIPNDRVPMIAGFSQETIDYLLGGMFRASYKPLNENIINGRIRGIAGVVGCNNARTMHDNNHLILIKELIKNDVIVLTTGCSAAACGKAGLLTPEAAREFAGAGLAEVCETVGIPPVLHMGACVDNSRILIAATAVVKEGGLGNDISELPAAGCAPEWMSEKAIAIGQYFVASGVYTIFGTAFPTLGSKEFTDYLFHGIEAQYGGKWDFVEDPLEMARKMIEHIDKARKALGIDKARDRVLFDMEKRRELA